MKQHSERFLKIVTAVKPQIKETSIKAVKAKLDKQENFYLVDVREESEWTQGRLPGAIHLSKGIIERDIEKTIPDTTAEIILYCGGGYRSALAAANLQQMGYTTVWSMDGGYRDWAQAGFAIVKP